MCIRDRSNCCHLIDVEKLHTFISMRAQDSPWNMIIKVRGDHAGMVDRQPRASSGQPVFLGRNMAPASRTCHRHHGLHVQDCVGACGGYIDFNAYHAIRNGMVQAILNLGKCCSGRLRGGWQAAACTSQNAMRPSRNVMRPSRNAMRRVAFRNDHLQEF